MEIHGISPREHRDLLLSVGTHRGQRRLSPLEVARLLQGALSEGMSREGLARALQIGTTQVSTFLRLLELDSEIQHLAGWGGVDDNAVAFSSLAQLARLDGPDQKSASQAILGHGLNWKEVVQLVQLCDRKGGPVSSRIDEVLKLRPQTERRYIFVGSVTDPALQAKLRKHSQSARDRILADALGSILEAASVRGRLGETTFTLLSSEALTESYDVDRPDELEQIVNDKLFELTI